MGNIPKVPTQTKEAIHIILYIIFGKEKFSYYGMAGHTANIWKHKLKHKNHKNVWVLPHTSQVIYLERTLEIINSTLLKKKGRNKKAAAEKIYDLPTDEKLITSKTKTTTSTSKTGALCT